MSSQLNVDTIVDKAGSGGTNVKVGNTSTYVADGGSATQNLVQGLAKTWHRFTEETTTATRDSFNVSSITDSGTGETVTTFTNNMSNANYASSSMATWQGDNRGGCWLCYNRGNTGTGNLPTTSTLETQAYAGGTSSLDPVDQDLDEASVIIHGDLA
jgi:hypothetical protein